MKSVMFIALHSAAMVWCQRASEDVHAMLQRSRKEAIQDAVMTLQSAKDKVDCMCKVDAVGLKDVSVVVVGLGDTLDRLDKFTGQRIPYMGNFVKGWDKTAKGLKEQSVALRSMDQSRTPELQHEKLANIVDALIPIIGEMRRNLRGAVNVCNSKVAALTVSDCKYADSWLKEANGAAAKVNKTASDLKTQLVQSRASPHFSWLQQSHNISSLSDEGMPMEAMALSQQMMNTQLDALKEMQNELTSVTPLVVRTVNFFGRMPLVGTVLEGNVLVNGQAKKAVRELSGVNEQTC